MIARLSAQETALQRAVVERQQGMSTLEGRLQGQITALNNTAIELKQQNIATHKQVQQYS